MLDEGESSQNAAIRETYEELGIEPKDINIIGPLTPLYIPILVSESFLFVGWITKRNKIKYTIQRSFESFFSIDFKSYKPSK